MGKKKLRAKYISKGKRVSMDRSIIKAVKSDRSLIDRELNKLDALLKKQNPWTTIPNPNSNERNKKFIRVRMNAVSLATNTPKWNDVVTTDASDL